MDLNVNDEGLPIMGVQTALPTLKKRGFIQGTDDTNFRNYTIVILPV
jgi:hypothetical protein